MVVRLPARRLIVVDSKVPLDGYLDAIEATAEEARVEALSRHARQTRDHISQLSSRDYQAEFEDAPEFVVAFIPSDSILAAAVEQDPELLEFALAKGVVVATPSTFFALLRAIAFGWRQEQIAENAQRVSLLGQQLSERLAVLVDHFEHVGGALHRAVDAYNATVGSLESRVLPSARRFRDYGVAAKEIPELGRLDVAPRSALLPSPGATDELFPEPDLEAADEPSGEPELTRPWDLEISVPTYTCSCKTCGVSFEGTGPNAQFCSEECRAGLHTAPPVRPSQGSGASNEGAPV
jgi:DNA recombination protein RmuC